MSRRKKLLLALTLLLILGALLAVKGGACRDPDPPTHPVPVDYDDTSTPIATPPAK